MEILFPDSMPFLILSAHAFDIHRVDPGFPVVFRLLTDDREAVALYVVKPIPADLSALRDLIDDVAILEPRRDE